jgi:hypothetical protein
MQMIYLDQLFLISYQFILICVILIYINKNSQNLNIIYYMHICQIHFAYSLKGQFLLNLL